MKHTEHTLKVLPISATKVLELLNGILPASEGNEYKISDFAIIINVSLDDECIYCVNEPRIHNGSLHYMVDIPVRMRVKNEDGSFSCNMFPSFYFPLSIEALEGISGQPITLMEFMGRRYNYNPRIKTNMREFLNDIGSQIPFNA